MTDLGERGSIRINIKLLPCCPLIYSEQHTITCPKVLYCALYFGILLVCRIRRTIHFSMFYSQLKKYDYIIILNSITGTAICVGIVVNFLISHCVTIVTMDFLLRYYYIYRDDQDYYI